MPAMFGRELHSADFMFGLGECLAHLNGLIARGLREHMETEEGIYLYQAGV